MLVGMTGDPTEPLSKAFSIAMLAAWTDFDAATQWVPGSIGPFDFEWLPVVVAS
jgi:hypothetical protein